MPLSSEDRLEILDLIARYNHAFDGGDAEGWADTFTDDGVFEGSRTLSNRQERIDYVRGRDPGVAMRHWNNNVLIEGDGDEATSKVYLLNFNVGGTPSFRYAGTYQDTLRRVDGVWRFTHRKVHPDPPYG